MSDLPRTPEEWRARLEALPPLPEKPRTCFRRDGTPKQRYGTLSQAWEAMKAMKARPDFVDSPRNPITVYPCARCDAYHMGRLPGSTP